MWSKERLQAVTERSQREAGQKETKHEGKQQEEVKRPETGSHLGLDTHFDISQAILNVSFIIHKDPKERLNLYEIIPTLTD